LDPANSIREIQFEQYGATNLHPLAIVFMLVMFALAFAPKRTSPILAVLSVCVLVPMEQRVVIGGLDFSLLRLILIAALVRVFVKGEHRGLRLGKLDRIFLAWVLVGASVYVLRVGPSGIANRLGFVLDALTAYFVIRTLVRTRPQLLALWRSMAWLSIILAAFMAYEKLFEYNFFGIFSETGFEGVNVRDGRVRAKGSLQHPILAGTFGASLVPIFFGIYRGRPKERKLFVAACVAGTVIVVVSGSSGPAIAWVVGVFGWSIWRFRRHMKKGLWTVTGILVVLHFVRQQPVWSLIGRLSSITGGTGYHRYHLIDNFIRRFSEWFILGINSTAHWGWGLQDTTNQYVHEGVKGGLVTLVLFIVILRTCFVQLRVARGSYERRSGPKSLWALLAWGTSVSLSVHCVSFISVSYFGQMVQFFVIFIATVPAVAAIGRPKRDRSVAPKPSSGGPAHIPQPAASCSQAPAGIP
jgi:hypothetical protein